MKWLRNNENFHPQKGKNTLKWGIHKCIFTRDGRDVNLKFYMNSQLIKEYKVKAKYDKTSYDVMTRNINKYFDSKALDNEMLPPEGGDFTSLTEQYEKLKSNMI